MNILELMLLPLFAVVLLILPVVYALKKKKSNGAAKTAPCRKFLYLGLQDASSSTMRRAWASQAKTSCTV